MARLTAEARDKLLEAAQTSLRRRGVTIDEETLLAEIEHLSGDVSPHLASDPLTGLAEPHTLSAARRVLALSGVTDPSEQELADALSLVAPGRGMAA